MLSLAKRKHNTKKNKKDVYSSDTGRVLFESLFSVPSFISSSWWTILSKPFRAKVLDNPRGVLHLGHFLSNPFPYRVLVQRSHSSRVEQAWHAINGNFAGVTWQIEHRNASSNDWINDKENLCRKASSRIFPISSLTSRTSSTKDSTASYMNALSDCSVELQLFLFFFTEGGVSSFPYSVLGMAKILREPTLQNPSSEKINRKLVKNPSVTLRVSPAPYALESIFKI